MHGPRNDHTKQNKSERERQILYVFIKYIFVKYMTNIYVFDATSIWNLKYDTDEPIYETETESGAYKTDLWLPRGKELEDGWTGSLGLANANYYIVWELISNHVPGSFLVLSLLGLGGRFHA